MEAEPSANKKIPDIRGHNILELFNVFGKFLFTISKTGIIIQDKEHSIGVASRVFKVLKS